MGARYESPHFYEFQLRRADNETGVYTPVAGQTVNDSFSPAQFTGVDDDYWYKAYGRNCRTSSRNVGCGDWRASNSVSTYPAVSPPTARVEAGGDTVYVDYDLASPDFSTHDYRLILRWGPNGWDENEQELELDASSDDPIRFTGISPSVGGWYRVDLQVCREGSRTACADARGELKFFVNVPNVDAAMPTV